MTERWWRVVRWLPDVTEGNSGHPAYVAVRYQGGGRYDNPRRYTAGYVAAEPQGAVGEAFANLPVWHEAMLRPGEPTGCVMALVELRAQDLRLLDLDDPHALIEYHLRPTDVVRRNRDRTQELGMHLFLEGKFDGVRWWSYHRPEWTNATIWRAHHEDGTPQSPFDVFTIESVEPLTLRHPSIVVAADVLNRVIEP